MSNLHILRYLRHRSRHNQASPQQPHEESENTVTSRRHRKVYRRDFLEQVIVDDVNCRHMCRFSIQEIYQIINLLGLEEPLYFNGISASRQMAFAMLVCRYSHLKRYSDMEPVFKMHRKNISKVCRGMEDLLFEKMKYGIQFNTHHFREENLKRLAAAIDEAGGLFPDVVGFIDGAFQQVSGPSTNNDRQKSLYNGWKHVRAIKYQSIVTPDGITSSIMGPVIGASHNVTTMKVLDAERRLQRHLHISDTEDYAIYGETPYTTTDNLYCPFPSYTNDPLELSSNKSMSNVQIAVEWEFAEVMSNFTFCKFKHATKVCSSNPAKVYILSTIFKNMLHCVRQGGYPTFSKFKVTPPTLEEYIDCMRREKIEGEDEDM